MPPAWSQDGGHLQTHYECSYLCLDSHSVAGLCPPPIWQPGHQPVHHTLSTNPPAYRSTLTLATDCILSGASSQLSALKHHGPVQVPGGYLGGAAHHRPLLHRALEAGRQHAGACQHAGQHALPHQRHHRAVSVPGGPGWGQPQRLQAGRICTSDRGHAGHLPHHRPRY